jgi:hypothetical protein
MLKGSGTRKLGGRDSLRAFQRFLGWSLVALFVSLFPSRAHAYTWMIKHGYASCPVCHADPSGGELLTAYGRVQSDELLRMKYGKSHSESSHQELKAPRLVRRTPDSKTDALSGAEEEGTGGETDAAATDAAATDAAATDEQAPAAEASTDAAPTASSEESDRYPGEFLWGLLKTPDWLLLGGSYRHLMVYRPTTEATKFSTFPMMMDLYGQVQLGNFRIEGSLGVARVDVGSPYARAAQLTTNQGDQWNLLSRSHWLGYDLADGAITIRAGHMNLPYGIRIPEHTMWVRKETLTDRESAQQDGVAFAYNGEKLRGEVMGILGNYQVNPDMYRQRGYSLYAEYLVGERTSLGVSSMVTKAKKDRITLEPDPLRQAHGAFVRSALIDDLVVLAEADALFTSDHDAGYVGFAQVDYELIRGLHLMATGEVLNRGYDRLVGGEKKLGNGKPQFGVWGTVDWFFLPHCEFRADAYSRQEDDFTILGQLHVFL